MAKVRPVKAESGLQIHGADIGQMRSYQYHKIC